jgi:chromosome segregation ATPase
MSPGYRFLIVLVVASLGLWGCAQGPANGPASAERLRALENKLAKIESDFHGAATTRDQLRKKLTTLEQEKDQLAQQVEQLQAVVKDRDSLKSQLATRTAERDNALKEFYTFRKGIKNLLGQAELFAAPASAPANTTAELAVQRKS